MWLSEKIYLAFQGEGKSLGKPVHFLRTTGCNLACTWCDTPFTWNWIGSKFKHPEKYDKKKEVFQLSVVEILDQLLYSKTKNLVISGGEPMLQQAEITELLATLKDLGWWIEIETNGTVIPTDTFLHLIDQINCSPKLLNSGLDNPKYKRMIPQALRKLARSPKVNFKFVVRSKDDLIEIVSLTNSYKIDSSRVYLMPEGKTKDIQEQRQLTIQALCREYGYNFSPRLHILMFGDKRGT